MSEIPPGTAAPAGANPGFGDALGGLGAIGKIAGGIIGAIGAQQAGAAQSSAYLANAAAAGTTVANARLSLDRSQQESDYNANRLRGKQIAGYGAAGVNPYGGSPLDVMGDTEDQIKFEAMNRFYTGEMAAQIASDTATADTKAAKAARQAANTNSFSDILGGVAGAIPGLGPLAVLAGQHLPF